MEQIEIKFFWPLTEQIPLELDYSRCIKPTLTADTVSTGQHFILNEPSWSLNNKLVFETDNISFRVTEKPNLIRRLVYKLIGFNWELK